MVSPPRWSFSKLCRLSRRPCGVQPNRNRRFLPSSGRACGSRGPVERAVVRWSVFRLIGFLRAEAMRLRCAGQAQPAWPMPKTFHAEREAHSSRRWWPRIAATQHRRVETRSRRDARPVGIRSVDRARTEKLRPVTPPITSLPHFRMPYYELVDQSMAGSPQGVTRGIMWQGASRSISPVIRTSTVFCGVIAGTA